MLARTVIIVSTTACVFLMSAARQVSCMADDDAVREKIEQLANKASVPFKGKFSFEIPPGYSQGEKEVREAFDWLSANADAALPLLIDFLDDSRYSNVKESGDVFVKNTVGQSCQEIVVKKVEFYSSMVSYLDHRGITTFPSFIESQGGVKPWYQGRRGKALKELQLESIDWLLSQTRPREMKAAQWDSALSRLSVMRAEIVRDGKAFNRRVSLPGLGK